MRPCPLASVPLDFKIQIKDQFTAMAILILAILFLTVVQAALAKCPPHRCPVQQVGWGEEEEGGGGGEVNRCPEGRSQEGGEGEEV